MTTKSITAAITLNARFARSGIIYLLVNRYTAFLVGVFLYSILMKCLGGLGGVAYFKADGSLALHQQYLELTLVFYLYCYFNMILRSSRWQALLAAGPLLFAYLGQDIYYLMYSNVFRFSEFAEVPELLNVLTMKHIALLLILVVAPLCVFLRNIDFRKRFGVIAGLLPLALLICAAEYYPEDYKTAYAKAGGEIVFWSDAVTAEKNGRFLMLLYREAERNIAQVKTEAFRDRPLYDEQARQKAAWVRTHSKKRNVHLVVLESFLDPTLFKAATYTKDPFHPKFKKIFGHKMGFSVSPVFGGKTAQAEFEVLCGVPAFEELAGVEFNGFTGAQANCLPGILEQAGYRTMASNAYKPNFFNAPNAYQGVGFGAIYFPKEYGNGSESYLSTGDTSGEMGYMFDRMLFKQNFDFIAPFLKNQEGPPLFNYVLTIYGHFPHILNKKKRPQVLEMISSFKDGSLEREANQFFFRTEAVAEYVNRLLELDEKSLIILVSDHLPPGNYGIRSYTKLRYLNNKNDSIHLNRILIIEDGTVKKYATIHHYDVPAMILNSITNGAYCTEHVCGFMENKFLDDRMERHDDYMRVMAHATE